QQSLHAFLSSTFRPVFTVLHLFFSLYWYHHLLDLHSFPTRRSSDLLIAWTKLIAFHGDPVLARCEIAAFRYRVLHVAARITTGARQTRLRIDKTWQWAAAIAAGWHRIRTAFG